MPADRNEYKGVICGDADTLLDEFIAKGLTFDLVLTDPPYNLFKDFGNDSDCLTIEEFVAITKKRVRKIAEILTPTGSLIWFGIHDYIGFCQVAMYEVGLHYRRMNIWHYENGFSRSKRVPATHYEPFLWFSKSNKVWTYNVDEVRVPYKSTERLKSPVNYRSSSGAQKTWKPNPRGAMRGDVWNFPTLAGRRFRDERTEHPTQKPEALITEILKAFCPMEGGVFKGRVLDPFHGSGTLGVCCEKLNLLGHEIEWTGIEIEERWCRIAEERLGSIK